ncbi:hypothetical protein POM88_032613 [Heracleum sosnowskyi]|uniref:Nuclease HARBI1 n=1 Tax=Heracleum sosnowskyi TaxID=360622 RepID=A0AAD8I2J4_9APIA|nr:hypothetical protein POM88_032613 [Heracleum sosnowskyi]
MDNTIFERVNQLRHWVQMQQLTDIQLVCLVAIFIVHRRNQRIKYVNLPSRELILHRQRVREEVMDDLSNRAKCRDTILDEQIRKKFIRKKRFFPYFKDCVGAIDGTHVRVRVPSKDVPRYRDRTASDSRIIKDALSRDYKLFIPRGKYYLVDAGLPHRNGLIAPFRGVRYHLKEFPIIRIEDHDLVAEEEVIKELENEDPEVPFFAPRDMSETCVVADEIRNRIENDMWANYVLHQQDNESDMEE